MIPHEKLFKMQDPTTQYAINKDYPFLQMSKCTIIYSCQVVSLHSNWELEEFLIRIVFTLALYHTKYDKTYAKKKFLIV